ncbi:unnamed protein product [Pedinophyceae sp. YPF-701]|nr:unnamed protein product [Pedinophyceae sp. YPF-701]
MVTKHARRAAKAAARHERGREDARQSWFEPSEPHARPSGGPLALAAKTAESGSTGQPEISLEEWEDATDAPGSTVDFGGRVLDLRAFRDVGFVLETGGKTISNCTIKGGLNIESPPPEDCCTMTHEHLRFVNVHFEGTGMTTRRRDGLRCARVVFGDLFMTGLVTCICADGVTFERCSFTGACDADVPGCQEAPRSGVVAGLFVSDSAVRVENCRFVDNRGPGLHVTNERPLGRDSPEGDDCRDTAVAIKDSRFAQNDYCGVLASKSAQVHVAGSQLDANLLYGLEATEGGFVRAVDTRIRGNVLGGVAAGARGRVVLEGCRVADSGGWALDVASQGSVTATDVVCSGCKEGGVRAREGGLMRLTRSAVRQNGRTGLCAVDAGSKLVASDVEVHRQKGTCVVAEDGGVVALKRCRVAGVGEGTQGVSASQRGSTVHMLDVDMTRVALPGVVVVAGGKINVKASS